MQTACAASEASPCLRIAVTQSFQGRVSVGQRVGAPGSPAWEGSTRSIHQPLQRSEKAREAKIHRDKPPSQNIIIWFTRGACDFLR